MKFGSGEYLFLHLRSIPIVLISVKQSDSYRPNSLTPITRSLGFCGFLLVSGYRLFVHLPSLSSTAFSTSFTIFYTLSTSISNPFYSLLLDVGPIAMIFLHHHFIDPRHQARPQGLYPFTLVYTSDQTCSHHPKFLALYCRNSKQSYYNQVYCRIEQRDNLR